MNGIVGDKYDVDESAGGKWLWVLTRPSPHSHPRRSHSCPPPEINRPLMKLFGTIFRAPPDSLERTFCLVWLRQWRKA